MSWKPGLLEQVYIAGTHLTGSTEVKISAAYIETADYVRDGHAEVTRAPVWGTATEGAPDSPRKWRIEIRYRMGATSAGSAEYFALQRLAASSGLVDLCVFKPIVETFRAYGKTSFRLSAGIAVQQSGATGAPGVLPSGLTLLAGYGAYATEVYDPTGVSISPTWESARDANGRQGFTPALQYGFDTELKVVYVPVFLARRVLAQPIFEKPHRESMRLLLESY